MVNWKVDLKTAKRIAKTGFCCGEWSITFSSANEAKKLLSFVEGNRWERICQSAREEQRKMR